MHSFHFKQEPKTKRPSYGHQVATAQGKPLCLRLMYSQHFGLTQDPFSIAPDPRYLFMSERHREALAHLLYGVGGSGRGTGGGFVLLTGDIGTGKTTICRCFLEQIPTGCHVAYIFNPKLTVVELLQSVCEEFHIDAAPAAPSTLTVKTYIDCLNAFLLQSHAAGQSCVLIIDEAQNLHSDVLEQLRLLTNLETNERKLLQIVLIGQPELRSMLARPELEQLAQRVIARFHLDALNASETRNYIQHRLAVAGHTGLLPFDARSLQRVQRLTGGVPRRINLLCGRSLLGAWATGLHRVTPSVVNKAAAEVFGPANANSATSVPAILLSAGALAVVVSLAGFLLWERPASESPLTTSPSAATQSVAPPALAAKPAGVLAVEDITTLRPGLPLDMRVAWRELAPVWKRAVSDADPCRVTDSHPLQCVRASDLTVPQLRQLNRPGILTLQPTGAPAVYAVLIGLSEQDAVLQIGAARHKVRTASLTQLWHGEFATFWRPPTGYLLGMPPGSKGPAVDLLSSQLATLEGTNQTAGSATVQALFDDALRERVRAFQRAQGLKPDGHPGPMTFMQLESALEIHVPRLQTEP